MPRYPYCTVGDVEARIRKLFPGGLSTTTEPTLAEAKRFMDQWASEIRNSLKVAEYDLDSIAADSGTASSVSGSTVTMKAGALIGDSNLAVGDDLMLQGVDANGNRVFEFGTVKTRTPSAGSGDVTSITLSTAVSESYSGEASVYVVNDAWRTLRKLNADAVAMQVEAVALLGSTPNRSEDAQRLSEVIREIRKMIEDVPKYLHDASTTSASKSDPQTTGVATFYTSNSSEVVDPQVEVDAEL